MVTLRSMLHLVELTAHCMFVSISLSVCLLICMQGFGFVTFASCMSAENARLAMNGAVVEGRKIEVQQQFHLLTYSVNCKPVFLSISSSLLRDTLSQLVTHVMLTPVKLYSDLSLMFTREYLLQPTFFSKIQTIQFVCSASCLILLEMPSFLSGTSYIAFLFCLK